jgi:putative peptidoglycan lipid II flippase
VSADGTAGRPRYAHLEGNNPWVEARRIADASAAAAVAVDDRHDGPVTGELPRVVRGQPRREEGDGTATAAPPTPASRSGAFLVGAGILLSRLAGLIREVAIGMAIGVGGVADAFKAALRIPNLLQNLLGEGVLSASFIPVYSRLLEEDEEEAGRVAGAVAGVLIVFTGVLTVLGVVFARPITAVLAPGFEDERLDLTVDLVRIMTPGIGFLVLSAWCLGVLNSHRRFFLSYVAPVLWNAAQVVAIVAVALLVTDASNETIARALAWGVLAGGVLQLAVQLPSVRQVGGHIRPSLDTGRAAVRDVGRRFVPVLFGRGVVQLIGYVDLVLASLLAVGAVSAFTYAQVLYLLPISLFGMSVAAAELPELSRLGAGDDAAGASAVRARLDDGLGRIAFFVAPIQAVYLTAGGVVTAALLQRQEFTADDAKLVWIVLAGASVALLATTASRLLQNALYALGDARTPALIAAVRVLVSAGLGVVLMFQLDHVALEPGRDAVSFVVDEDALPAPLEPLPDEIRLDEDAPLRIGAAGLTIAASVSAWMELVALRVVLRRRIGSVRVGGRDRTAVLGSAAAAGVVALLLRWSALGDLAPLVQAVAVLGPAAVVYLALTSALGVAEARRLRTAVTGSRNQA